MASRSFCALRLALVLWRVSCSVTDVKTSPEATTALLCPVFVMIKLLAAPFTVGATAAHYLHDLDPTKRTSVFDPDPSCGRGV
jgi:hypothetical protein